MNKKIIIKVFFLLLGTVGICWADCSTKSPVFTHPSGTDANSVESILEQLNKKTEELQSYEAQIKYKFSQPLLESQSIREGVLYYAKNGQKSLLRINFQTLKQDDEKQQKYIEHYILDGIWLTHIDYQIKTVKCYQMAEPNEPLDVFDLASKNLPIIGFTKIEDLKKQFEIKLVEQKKEHTPVIPAEAGIQDFIQLHLKVKADSVYKDDYTSIDFWIDKKLYLPSKIIAASIEEDIYEIKFIEPKVNEKMNKKVFDFKIPDGFSVEIEPLKKSKGKMTKNQRGIEI